MSEHDAAIITKSGAALTVIKRATPNPGTNEVLVQVKSVALNPVDYIQRDRGFHMPRYPSVLGSDASGVIVKLGSNMTSSTSPLKVGDRVTAFASAWFRDGDPNYGSFQQFVIAPAETVTVIPDTLSFNEASLFPMAVQTGWFAFMCLNIARETRYTKEDKQAILIWGVGGSVGSITLQIAKSMGFIVYATASEKHHSYLQSLGKGPGQIQLFDYNDPHVVSKIVEAVKADGLTMNKGISATGYLQPMIDVLRQTKALPSEITNIAACPFSFGMLWWKLFPTWSKTRIVFVVEPAGGQKALLEADSFIFREWLTSKLESGEIVPSPKIELVSGGLNSIQSSLNDLKKGASGIKYVMEL